MKSVVIFFTVSVALAQGALRLPTPKDLEAFLRAVPRIPVKNPAILPASPIPAIHAEFNRTFRGQYKPQEACSLNRTMEMWEYGVIQTPNYPEDYPADTSCEWILEGPPGSRIQATIFDLETQSWFLGYYDYVALSRDGNFEKVDQFAGDANANTPFVSESIENKYGVRFKSNGFLNYRGLKMGFVVRPAEETADNGYQISNDDGICGRSFILGSATEAPVESTTSGSVDETTTEGTGETTPEITTGTATEATTEGTRIIGHTPAEKHAYPWMVALLINGRSFCGGTIIDDQHIMTAGKS